jgi:hypothetical protein
MPGPPGEAKLVKPPPALKVEQKPLGRALPPKPDPRAAKPDVLVAAKGEGPLAAANLGVDGLSETGLNGDWKTDGALVELPRVPNGDCSELAKAAKPDEANAEAEVTWAGLLNFSFSVEASEGFGDARDANGETADVFEKGFGREV